MFKAAAQGGALPLVNIGVIASGVAAYFYVRVIVSMFFSQATDDTPLVVAPDILSTAAIAVYAPVTVVLGIFKQPLLDLADHAVQPLH